LARSQFERIWKVWLKLLNAAGDLYPLGTAPNLVISDDTNSINAFANAAQNQITTPRIWLS
jgi:hypothetical protein